MNPLDPLELSSFNERLLDIMPQQTEKTLKIPKVMYGQLPKNLKNLSNERFEKTLNKHQHTIEEILHRDKKNSYSEWFRQYTRKYFIESISHNSFFKNTILPDLSDIRQIGRQHNNSFISFLPHVNGADLTTGGDTSNNTSAWQNFVMAIKLSTGVVGQYYNQIALDVLTSAGNYRLGVYDDSSGPNNLYQQTGSIAVPVAGYTFQSLTEFALTNTSNWSSFICDNASLTFYYKSAGGNKSYKAQSYGALPNPAGSGYSTDTNAWTMKVGHS